jgi:hypothetical protein
MTWKPQWRALPPRRDSNRVAALDGDVRRATLLWVAVESAEEKLGARLHWFERARHEAVLQGSSANSRTKPTNPWISSTLSGGQSKVLRRKTRR